MIQEEILSKRYADAFLAYAKETIGFDKGMDELIRAKRIMRDNPLFQEALSHLEITDTEKSEIINTVFGSDFAEETRHLLNLLIRKKRIHLFVDIAEYARIHYAHGLEMDALLKTSYPLPTDTIQRIKDAIEARLKKKIHMYVQLDADLVGGAYARIGNTIIDGSVKRRLEDIRDKLDTLKVV